MRRSCIMFAAKKLSALMAVFALSLCFSTNADAGCLGLRGCGTGCGVAAPCACAPAPTCGCKKVYKVTRIIKVRKKKACCPTPCATPCAPAPCATPCPAPAPCTPCAAPAPCAPACEPVCEPAPCCTKKRCKLLGRRKAKACCAPVTTCCS